MTSLAEGDQHLRSVDHVLRRLIDERGPIDPATDRRGSRPDPYQALARAIVGQQLSTKAAGSIWARVTELFGGDTPSPAQLLEVESQELRDAGYLPEAVRNRTFEGKIGFIDVTANLTTHQVRIWAEVPNEGNMLVAGLPVEEKGFFGRIVAGAEHMVFSVLE